MSDEDFKVKYLKYKTKYIELKKQINEMKGGDLRYQCFLDFIGTDNILANFSEIWLGRECNKDINIITENKKGQSLRFTRLDEGFSGVVFTGAHWKGYENYTHTKNHNKADYDSYDSDIQIGGTMNFCQSYAIFMWASQGTYNKQHKINLVKKEYVDNVQKMSSLWLGFFNYMNSFSEGQKWLYTEIVQMIKTPNCKNAGMDTVPKFFNEIMKILNILISDRNAAWIFAQSK